MLLVYMSHFEQEERTTELDATTQLMAAVPKLEVSTWEERISLFRSGLRILRHEVITMDCTYTISVNHKLHKISILYYFFMYEKTKTQKVI